MTTPLNMLGLVATIAAGVTLAQVLPVLVGWVLGDSGPPFRVLIALFAEVAAAGVAFRYGSEA